MNPSQSTVVLMMGSAVRKTTVGGRLAHHLGWRFNGGDEIHPSANVARMKGGQPLTDDGRAP